MYTDHTSMAIGGVDIMLPVYAAVVQ